MARSQPVVADHGRHAALDVLREPLFWLALVLALSRFWRLSQWSLWEDEVFTLSDARRVLVEGAAGVPKNPLGYLLFAGLVRAVGEVPGEFALRFVPALLGVLGIAASGFCFTPIFGARRAAATAAILAASTWHLYWSQNARFYTLTQDFALLGGALCVHAIFRPRGERFGWTALAALAALLLAALAQSASALLLPAFLLAAILITRIGALPTPPRYPISRKLLALLGLLGLAFVLYLAPIWADYYRTKHDPTALHLIKSSGWFFTPVLLAAALFGSFGAWKQRQGPDLFVAMGCLFAALLALGNALFVRAAAQYLFVLLPFVALLATWPLSQRNAPRGWKAGWLAVLLIPALLDQYLYFTQRNGDRPPWRDAFAEVFTRREPGDLVFTNNANVGEYYFAPNSATLRHPTHVHNLDRYSFLSEQHWARQPRRAWFVINHDRLKEWPKQDQLAFEAMLASNARRVKSFVLTQGVRDIDVHVYLRE